MKTKMKVFFLLAIGMAFTLCGRAQAYYTTMRSTAIYISSAATYPDGMEFLSLSYSTGSSTLGDQFIVVLDTNDPRANNTGQSGVLKGGTTLQGTVYGRGRFPPEQHIVPPIIVFTTAPLNNPAGATSTGFTRLDFRDHNGCGIPVTEGLEVLLLEPAVSYGTIVTVEWRPRPTMGICKQQ